MVQARRVTSKVQSSLWFIPVLCVLVGAALSFSSIAIDEATNYDLVPSSLTGGPDAALQILSTIAASMVSLAALVLTITMVVVQLAMGQFSPRIVQTFLRDKPSQIAVGLFIATFVHAMLTLREIHGQRDGAGTVDRRRLRARRDQRRGPGALHPPHRSVAPGICAHRAGRFGHESAARPGVPG